MNVHRAREALRGRLLGTEVHLQPQTLVRKSEKVTYPERLPSPRNKCCSGVEEKRDLRPRRRLRAPSGRESPRSARGFVAHHGDPVTVNEASLREAKKGRGG